MLLSSIYLNIEHFAKGILIGLCASAPLGPIGVLAIQRTINKGLISGYFSGLGAAFADTFYAVIAGFGLSIISNFLTSQQVLLRIVGTIFLLYVGLKIFFTNPAKQFRHQQRKRRNYVSDFFSVFFLTLSNPITIIALGAVFAGFDLVNEQSTFFSTFFLTCGVFIGAMLWWLVMCSVFNFYRKKIRLRNLWWLNKITGMLIVILGLTILIVMFVMG